jgi:hypothetical protein
MKVFGSSECGMRSAELAKTNASGDAPEPGGRKQAEIKVVFDT